MSDTNRTGTQSAAQSGRRNDEPQTATERARAATSDAGRRAAEAVEANPLGILVGGLAVGALAGALIPRSDKEKELLAPVGKRLGKGARAAIAAAKDAGKSELESRGFTADAAALKVADEVGAEADDDGALIAVRTVGADGRSRAHLGGRAVPVGVLARLAESALAVHLRAVPQVVIQRAQRRARKAYALKDGTIPEDVREPFFEMQNDEILGQTIVRVVDRQGNDYEVDPKHVGEQLRGALPLPQWDRLMTAFNTLVFNDQLARAAVSDPGF